MINLKQMKTGMASQRGLSLVELMIAIALGLFLIWGVTQSFLTSRQSYRLQQGVGRIQENGRLAQEFLGFEIRNAGDYGCASGDDFVTGAFDERNDVDCDGPTVFGTKGINMITNTDFADTAFEYAVYGFNDNDVDGTTGNIDDGTNDINLSINPKADTDVLVLRLSNELAVLTAVAGDVPPPVVNELASLSVNRLVTLANTQAIAVSDCATTKIFRPDTATNSNSIDLSTTDNYCLYAGFQAGASVRTLQTVYYFVATSVAGNSFSLYRQAGEGAAAEELLEGVEDMQLEFGIDDDSDSVIDDWDEADNITEAEWNGWDYEDPDNDPATDDGTDKDPNLIRAVRYSLLLVTEDAVLGEPQSLMYNGAAFTDPGDGRLRQVFTSSVGIRSRINPDTEY